MKPEILASEQIATETILRRSKLEIVMVVLSVIEKNPRILRTPIMYKANLSWIALRNVLSHIEELKLVDAETLPQATSTKGGMPVFYPERREKLEPRVRYTLSPEGYNILTTLKSIEAKLNLERLDLTMPKKRVRE